MSAGQVAAPHEPQPCNEISGLAPRFLDAVQSALSECRIKGYDAIVYESYRSQELQDLYYARGRTVVPPHGIVTNVKDVYTGWHGYGLACDIISKSKLWDAGEEWFRAVAEIFKSHGCDAGIDWHMKDEPHVQWGKCKASPSDEARALFASGGLEAVWKAVGATYEKAA